MVPAILLGLLGAAAFPPLGLWPLSLLSIAGFLFLLDNRSPREGLAIGLLYGISYASGCMYWFFGIFGAAAILLISLVGSYFAILAVLIASTRDSPTWIRALSAGLFAVGIEWLRGDCWYLRFPWYTVAHALAAEPAWIAAARWIGTFGISLIVWSLSAVGAFGRLYAWVAILVLPAFSWFLPSAGEGDRRALLVQSGETATLEMQMDSVLDFGLDLAVLPEYSYLTSPDEAVERPHGPREFALQHRCPVVFGAVEGDFHRSDYQNVAAVVGPDGRLLGAFPKQRPVPLMRDGRPGTDRPLFSVENGTLGVGVCYDFDNQEVAADLVRRGATVLVVPTHDSRSIGWVRNYHHSLLLRLRAVETGRWVLRAVNTGRCEAIDPTGLPSARGIGMGKVGYVIVRFAHRDGLPLGVWAHLLGPTAAAFTGVYVIWLWGCALMGRFRAKPLVEQPGLISPPSSDRSPAT